MKHSDDTTTIVGAGPAGLACAIILAHGGRQVIVHERRSNVGARFHGDYQGLENWTGDLDVLEELASAGINPSFRHWPISHLTAFDADGDRHDMRSDEPFCYLVRRGSTSDTLDHALLDQALAAGVQVRFNSTMNRLSSPGVLAAGPARGNIMAVGYQFHTTMADGQWVAVSDDLAPGGYAYLLVRDGCGTVACCMFGAFHESKAYLQRTVAFFSDKVGLEMHATQRISGVGNYGIPCRGEHEGHLLVGEHAGFQDALAGFGMRSAIRSGIHAANSLLGGGDYEARWRQSILPGIRQSISNRLIYARMGRRGRRALLRRIASGDARVGLARLYRPHLWGRMLYPFAELSGRMPQKDPICCHRICTCVRCRCGH